MTGARGVVALGLALFLPAAAQILAGAKDAAARAGQGPAHLRAAALGSLLLVVLGALLVHRVLAGLVARAAAVAASALIVYATSLYWYAVHAPSTRHAPSFFMGAAVLAVWWDGRSELSPRRALAVGLLAGLAGAVRWQNVLLLLLPASTLLRELRRHPGPALRKGALAGLGAAVGVLVPRLAFEAIGGNGLLAALAPAEAPGLARPALLEAFFSSRHGLLYWTPVAWGGLLGLVALFRRDARAAAGLVPALAVMTWLNASALDAWAADSFSNRRFDAELALLGVGLGLALEALRAAAARRPGGPLVALGLGLTAWNFLFMQQYRDNRIPRDDTVSFPHVAENSAAITSELLGTPLAWPANWIWAWRHDAPSSYYDRMVGKRLFAGPGDLDGVIDLGAEATDALAAEGWGVRVRCGDQICRGLRKEARVFAPLDRPEPLEVRVRACGAGALALTVGGQRLAEWPLQAALENLRVRVPAHYWRRGHNPLVLEASEGGWAAVDRLEFERTGPPSR